MNPRTPEPWNRALLPASVVPRFYSSKVRLFNRQAGLDPGLGAALDVEEVLEAGGGRELAGQGAARAHLADENYLGVLLKLGLAGEDRHVRYVGGPGHVPTAILARRPNIDDLGALLYFFFRFGRCYAPERLARVLGGHFAD